MNQLLEFKPLICERCGGTIDRKTMRCPYCGTEYIRENNGDQIRIVVDRPGVQKISTQVRVDMDMMADSPEGARAYVLDRMRHEVADALLAFMKISTAEDYSPLSRCQIIRGEIRVIDPTFTDY